MSNVRWNVVVSPQVDQSVRMFLAAHGSKKGDLSRFIEEAVRAHLLDSAVSQAKHDVGASMDESELDALIDEAVRWARQP